MSTRTRLIPASEHPFAKALGHILEQSKSIKGTRHILTADKTEKGLGETAALFREIHNNVTKM